MKYNEAMISKKIFFAISFFLFAPFFVSAMGQPVPQSGTGTQQPGTGTSQPGTGTQQPGTGTSQPGQSIPIVLASPFNCQDSADSPCIIQIFQSIVGRLLLIIYPLLAGMVFYGGLQMMLARGSTEKYKAGLKTIQYAVIGFVAIILSQGVAYVIQSILSL
jgi:hypothetical protein